MKQSKWKRNCCLKTDGQSRPNFSLNPDASPAALARRPLGAG
jgi:hypothetical protein